MDKVSDDGYTKTVDHPRPADFDEFLPWACSQLSVEANVIITRRLMTEYVGIGSTPKTKRQKARTPSYTDSDSSTNEPLPDFTVDLRMNDSVIFIETIYDSNLNLVHIKFLNNKKIPRMIIKLIGLILQFHTKLSAITINSGLQMGTMYEISKILDISRITDICLDNTFLIEANYHLLLNQSTLKQLSLSKCKINDIVVKTIASKLVYTYPASNSLSILNLATNRITDVGVKYLADMLRTNRQLSYLNLADNMITDVGAMRILDSLAEFPLTMSELLGRRARYMDYLKEKNELIQKTFQELRAGDFERRAGKRKSIKTGIVTTPKKKMLGNDVLVSDTPKGLPSVEAFHLDRAEIIVDSTLGPFKDPFSQNNTESRDGNVYCYGNNTLCYLNVAYNSLTYCSLKKLYEVLLTQKVNGRRPKGLVNVMIEGNYLPEACEELQEIDDIIDSGLITLRKMSMFGRKKSTAMSRLDAKLK